MPADISKRGVPVVDSHCIVLGLLLWIVGPVNAIAQSVRTNWPMPVDATSSTTGSADEESLLLLQLVGRAPLIPIGIRSFSARELDTLVSFEQPNRATRRIFSFSRTQLGAIYNSGRAYGENDGVVWAGRGLTGTATAGAVGRVGPISFAVRPVAFWTENRSFRPTLASPADSNFADPVWGAFIDLPYRFGNKSYARVDPGESWVQLDTRFIVAGFSTATQQWGPMHVYPLLLGPNAGGWPHVLFGTGLPWNIGIGKLSGRMAVGRLDASAFAPPHPGDERRLASELIATFTPAGIDGLEIGGGRFFHRRWPVNGFGLEVLEIPLEGFLKDRLVKDATDAVQDNQLASAFFRLVRPASGVEIYGEFLRDDHSYDLNDFVGEPDHESAYALGLRRAWGGSRQADEVTALTVELANGRISRLSRLRGEDPMYIHQEIVEGHTERGKLLGSSAAFGGSGFYVGLERRAARGGWRLALSSEATEQNLEGGTVGGLPAGFYSIALSKIIEKNSAEYVLSAGPQIPWNNKSGPSNLSLSVSYRP